MKRLIIALAALVVAGLMSIVSVAPASARCIVSPPPVAAPCGPVKQVKWVYVKLTLSPENWEALRRWGVANGFSGNDCWWNANPIKASVPKTARSNTQSVRVKVRVGVTYVVDMPAWTKMKQWPNGIGHYQTFGPFNSTDGPATS